RLFSITNEIKVVHNFIDTEKYDRESQNECQRIAVAKPEERILTHISNFRPVKRIEDVVKIFYNVQKQIPAKLLMVGEGPEKRNAELLVKKLGIKDKVIFLGNSNEISKILCYTDVFLLPSESESFGLAALEAMAASTAVISTNTGGLSEVNIQGKTGYLSNLGDCDKMAMNAISILKDDETLMKFKKAAKEHTKQFCLDNILPVYENIYNAALHKIH
ncbi:MAG: N-acetyl-alpha-D-glucosaminyl L-malate synthase BshA, partial [Flavobacteriaceae bacterium]|nr:N-acetyl-alpha-D-glucosaminyl L-malate synthase BshA [Flavobacteriaceae bacterium]